MRIGALLWKARGFTRVRKLVTSKGVQRGQQSRADLMRMSAKNLPCPIRSGGRRINCLSPH